MLHGGKWIATVTAYPPNTMILGHVLADKTALFDHFFNSFKHFQSGFSFRQPNLDGAFSRRSFISGTKIVQLSPNHLSKKDCLLAGGLGNSVVGFVRARSPKSKDGTTQDTIGNNKITCS